jgi:hypothetical protein
MPPREYTVGALSMPRRSEAAPAGAALALAPAEAEALVTEAAVYAQALPDPASRTRYTRLAAAAADGSVPSDLLPALETMLELVLQKASGPTARQPLLGIFAKTPRGRALGARAREVTRALRALRGQQIQELRLSAGPGQHSLVIHTDQCQLTLELTPQGARIASLDAG